jgi:hypothetical protein
MSRCLHYHWRSPCSRRSVDATIVSGLTITKAGELAIAQWRRDCPKDVETKLNFFVKRKVERKRERAENGRKKVFIEAQLAGPSTIGDDDDRWLDFFITNDECTKMQRQ